MTVPGSMGDQSRRYSRKLPANANAQASSSFRTPGPAQNIEVNEHRDGAVLARR